MKNIAIWRIMTYFSQENIRLVSFSWQQLAIIRNKNCTFALRKRGELLDGELGFSMTLENERWNGKNGGFFYRLEDEKRFSTVLSVKFS